MRLSPQKLSPNRITMQKTGSAQFKTGKSKIDFIKDLKILKNAQTVKFRLTEKHGSLKSYIPNKKT